MWALHDGSRSSPVLGEYGDRWFVLTTGGDGGEMMTGRKMIWDRSGGGAVRRNVADVAQMKLVQPLTFLLAINWWCVHQCDFAFWRRILLKCVKSCDSSHTELEGNKVHSLQVLYLDILLRVCFAFQNFLSLGLSEEEHVVPQQRNKNKKAWKTFKFGLENFQFQSICDFSPEFFIVSFQTSQKWMCKVPLTFGWNPVS